MMDAILTCPCSYSLVDRSGQPLASGEGELKLDKETLSIMTNSGEPIYLPLVDISQISLGEYLVKIGMASGEMLHVHDLGYKFGDLVSNLYAVWNEVIVKHLLMNESRVRPSVSAEITQMGSSGERNHESCEIRLYETSLVLMPSDSKPVRIHFNSIAEMESKDFSITLEVDSGDRVVISKLGSEYDNLVRDLSNATNALNLKSQELLKELSPSASPTIVRNAARLMKDGRTVSSADIRAISGTLWTDLEKKLELTQIWNEYQYLKSISRSEKTSAGMKRGLMGDLTGDYLWLLFPIYGNNSDHGNIIALESTKIPRAAQQVADSNQADELQTGGGATYFFRITGRDDYARISNDIELIDTEVDHMIHELGRLLLDINFRREPIYLPDDKINSDPQYSVYRYAVQWIPSLQELRRLFIGRVIHSSFDQWKVNVENLLAFSKSAPDGAKWIK